MTSKKNNNNSFKEMQDEDLDKNPQAPKLIENNLNSNMQSMHTFGNVVELYISKVVDLFVALLGGKKNDEIESNNNSNNDTDNAPEGNSNRT